MNDNEYIDEAEAAAALDPAIGDGTPDSAPHVAPYDDDDDVVADETSGAADDDDVVEDDDDSPIDDDI
jgi:hypothetical protein